MRTAARFLFDVGLHGLAGDTLQREWAGGRRSAALARSIGNARLHEGENAEAQVFFREACKRDASDAEARAGLICALFRQGRSREAAREAEMLASIDSGAEMWLLLAELRRRSGDTIGSLTALRQAAQSVPADRRFVLGDALFGEEVWAGLVMPLARLKTGGRAVGVGTHLVRSRGSLVARAMAVRRKVAAAGAALLLISGEVRAQDPTPSPSPSPTPTNWYHADAVKALPTAGSLTARVVQLPSGLVLEREEGVGLFPAEPSRFAFRGGAWTQSRIEIDGFDVTDPLFGGRAVVFGSVDLGEVGVRTDSKGTVLVHDHRAQAPGATRFLIQGNLGLFDSTGTTADPIPSLARGHHLFDGLLAASGASSSGATTWSGAFSGVDVSRSERDSDLERATARLGVEARAHHTRGYDRYQGLAMYQGRRSPFGLTTAETRSTGMIAGLSWTRAGQGGEPRDTWARGSYRRGSTEDPGFGSALLFERLVDGTPAMQVPYSASTGKFELEAGRSLGVLGPEIQTNLVARFSRAGASRSLTQPTFASLERLNGVSARQWTFSGASASRLSETRASVLVTLGRKMSERTRLTANIELHRLTVGDRDGEGILSSTAVLPELRFDWKKSETTELYVEASIGAPPVPFFTYEAATRNAPTASARLWRDQNGDGQATASELGVEVARRGPASVGVDPDLSLPVMRRVIIGFQTKWRALGIHATAWARRDRNLIETALNPPGFEIARVRSLPDPSGDIVGASDDQILPIIEESARSFSSSPSLLTNPSEHRALGEGAELGFETNGQHIHWGLTGAAFRVSGRGGNRGLRVAENDFGVVGESFDRTNADTFGYGRLFFDRAYSLRMWLTANDIAGFTFGALGRYDDGQPFARHVIQYDLPQGPDFVQAIPRGRARLHYTLSVDARVSKRFSLSGADIEISASVFNALGSQFEAEEQVVWLPDYRRINMVQPPRAFIVGVRIER